MLAASLPDAIRGAALALVALVAVSGSAAASDRHHRSRTVCVTYHDPGAGPVRICGLAIRRR